MAKIPFSIEHREKIESGEYKVETKNGRPIRVLAWDLPCDFPIATAEFTEDNRVIVESYSVDGWVGYGEKENNLVIVTPEPELSEFEKAFDRIAELYHSDKNPDEVACCKEYAAKLLSIARKQLQPEIDAEIEKAAYKTSDDVQYRKGREEALKDLPRWREWENGAAGNNEGHPIALVSGACGIRFVSVLGVTGEKYIMLDDLKKLPGFKED